MSTKINETETTNALTLSPKEAIEIVELDDLDLVNAKGGYKVIAEGTNNGCSNNVCQQK